MEYGKNIISEEYSILSAISLDDIIFKTLCNHFFTEAGSQSLNYFNKILSENLSFKLIFDNKIVGILLSSYDNENSIVKMKCLGIIEEHRGKGLSKNLMATTLDFLVKEKCYNKFDGYVEVDNVFAWKMYEKFGFVIKDTIKEYYEKKQNAYYIIKEV